MKSGAVTAAAVLPKLQKCSAASDALSPRQLEEAKDRRKRKPSSSENGLGQTWSCGYVCSTHAYDLQYFVDVYTAVYDVQLYSIAGGCVYYKFFLATQECMT